MTTPDAGQRLIEDLRKFATAVDITRQVARRLNDAANFIDRQLRVEKKLRDALKEIAYAGSSVPHGMDEASFNRGQFYTCIRIAANAIAASRSTGAADVTKDGT